MTSEDILKTAHIHLESSMYRIHVEDSSVIDVKLMNHDEGRPKFINGVSRSSDPTQNKTSILIDTCGEVDMNEFADWVNSYL